MYAIDVVDIINVVDVIDATDAWQKAAYIRKTYEVL